MAKFSLHIETDDATELAELALRLAAGVNKVDVDPSYTVRERLEALETSQRNLAEVEAQAERDAWLANRPDYDDEGSKKYKSRRGRPPKAAEPEVETPVPQADPVVETPAPALTPSPAPAVADEAVTYDSLKTLLTEFLKAKSVKEAQDVIRETTGGRAASLTQLSQDDYPAVAAALRKALQ